MTVITALKSGGKVYMGCDSSFLDVSSYQVMRRTSSKLIVKEEMIIGLTTEGSRIFQIISFKLKLPSTKKLKNDQLLEYMSTVFCPKLLKILGNENMLVEDTDKKATLSPATILVGIRDKIFLILDDFDVSEVATPFMCIGGGGDYSIGSLQATTTLISLSPEQHILTAMETAEKFNASVRGPYHIINTEELCLSEHF